MREYSIYLLGLNLCRFFDAGCPEDVKITAISIHCVSAHYVTAQVLLKRGFTRQLGLVALSLLKCVLLTADTVLSLAFPRLL